MPQYNFLQQKAIEHPRVAGGIAMALEAFLFYTGFLEPYRQVLAQSPEVRFYLAPTIISIPVVLIGLSFIVFGNKYAHVVFQPVGGQSVRERYVFYAVVILITLAVMWGLQQWAATKGYAFG